MLTEKKSGIQKTGRPGALGRKDFDALTSDYYERDDPKLLDQVENREFKFRDLPKVVREYNANRAKRAVLQDER